MLMNNGRRSGTAFEIDAAAVGGGNGQFRKPPFLVVLSLCLPKVRSKAMRSLRTRVHFPLWDFTHLSSISQT